MSPDSARIHLSPEADIAVTVVDETLGGSPLHCRRPDDLVREAFAPVDRAWTDEGMDSVGPNLPSLLDEARESSAFLRLMEPTSSGWVVRADVLRPDPSLARFAGLVVSCSDQSVTVELDAAQWPEVHRVVAALAGPGMCSEEVPASLDAAFAAWKTIGAIEQGGPGEGSDPGEVAAATALRDLPVEFHGHNTVRLSSATTTALVDPFLRPPHPYDATGYRPYSVAEIGRIDVVAITHSHPDHFDPATLLRFDPSTPVIVPCTGSESVLTIELARRLRELGFDQVIELAWWSTYEIGDLQITALPFYGEQPTDTSWMHPEVCNEGNTYLVSGPEWSVALLADAGHDHRGATRDVARQAAARFGSPDIVFGGYRAWQVRPFQLLRSSVARYLLLVPPDQWDTPQQLMAGIDDLLDTAEAIGARAVVPYADGGAPWYWQIGLGPRLDTEPFEHPDLDPFPERVLDAADQRTSSPRVLLARPNDGLSIGSDGVEIVRPASNGWPYADRVAGG